MKSLRQARKDAKQAALRDSARRLAPVLARGASAAVDVGSETARLIATECRVRVVADGEMGKVYDPRMALRVGNGERRLLIDPTDAELRMVERWPAGAPDRPIVVERRRTHPPAPSRSGMG